MAFCIKPDHDPVVQAHNRDHDIAIAIERDIQIGSRDAVAKRQHRIARAALYRHDPVVTITSTETIDIRTAIPGKNVVSEAAIKIVCPGSAVEHVIALT